MVSDKDLEGKKVARVFLAASSKEARLVEEILTRDGIDYVVEAESFVSGLLTSPAQGVAFYVLAGQAAYCRQRFAEAGLRQGIIEDD